MDFPSGRGGMGVKNLRFFKSSVGFFKEPPTNTPHSLPSLGTVGPQTSGSPCVGCWLGVVTGRKSLSCNYQLEIISRSYVLIIGILRIRVHD